MIKDYQIYKDEYPLRQYATLCPSARFVGGVSRYLCECKKPLECEGVKAQIALDTKSGIYAPESKSQK